MERTVNQFVSLFSFAVLAQPLPWSPSISSFQSYDGIFEFSLDDGCHYDAHITGTLTPVFPYQENGRDVEPDFNISVQLDCPRMAPLRVKERIQHTGPLSRERVEALISNHATISREDADRKCSHVPAIRIQGDGLVCTGVTTLFVRDRRGC
jgi:hypothetical protein